MDLQQQITTIRKTGHVHRNWYLETYPDVAELGMEPAEHYLKYGAAMGRDPGKNFSTRFYLECYPDVADTGLNPLLHYARFGKKEGRRIKTTKKSARARRLIDYLWSSPAPEAVLPELMELMNSSAESQATRFEIAYEVAVRKAFDGEVGTARDIMEQVDTIAPDFADTKTRYMIHAFVLKQMHSPEKARDLLQRCLNLPGYEADPHVTLAFANTCATDAERLAEFNKVYTRAGLATLQLRDPAKPLSLGNIEGSNVHACPADHGLVSIIMPIYGAEQTVEAAIRSLCQQSYRNIEIIAVDDCSPDNTFAILQKMAAEDPRIKPIRQIRNTGAYPARNRGMEVAKGDFVTTHDADDWSHPQKIETQIKALVSGSALGVAAHWVRVRPDLHVTPDWRISPNLIDWSHSTFMARRSLFDELGPWDNVRISADTELIWRMQAVHGRNSLIKICPKAPLALALNDDSSLTRAKQTHVSSIYYGLRRFYREIAQFCHQKPDPLSPENQALRRNMIPVEMFQKPDGPVTLDLVLRGDCTNPETVSKMHGLLQGHARAGHRAGIDHHPDTKRVPGRFTAEFFEMLQRPDVRLIVPGTIIHAEKEIDCNE